MTDRTETTASPAALRGAFANWLAGSPPLKISIHVEASDDRGTAFRFNTCNPAISGWVGHDKNRAGSELIVQVEHQDIWDALLWPDDVRPELRPSGWVCATCERSNGYFRVGTDRTWSDPVVYPCWNIWSACFVRRCWIHGWPTIASDGTQVTDEGCRRGPDIDCVSCVHCSQP
jgi:hypothetical protein